MNKKAQFQTTLLVVITIFIIGIILFFFNHLNNQLYSSLDKYLNESAEYNESEARSSVQRIQTVENSVWDYAFLAIFIGLLIQILMFSFATRANIAFYWLLVLIDIPILIVGVVLSNIWQELAINPEFAVTITRFPITNTLLGTYFPIALTVIFFFGAVILFGKKPGGEG